ncbi:MAG: hypothetical protein NT154_12675 [Verrucomicrobia bacterium]|nr:hypothetical protein [Verrucomicrobiota bacterium]
MRLFSGEFKRVYGISPYSRSLTWRVPFDEVVQKLQTVAGISELWGVTPKTIYRRGLPVGDILALPWVVNHLRGTLRALVKHQNPQAPLNLQPNLRYALSLIRGLRRARGGVVGNTLVWDSGKKRKRRRKSQVHVWKHPRRMTEKELRDFQKKEKAGQVIRYRPQGRVTVPQLCVHWAMNRRKFYRWRDSLLPGQLKLLESALAGPKKPIQVLEQPAVARADSDEGRGGGLPGNDLEPCMTKDEVYENLFAQLDSE